MPLFPRQTRRRHLRAFGMMDALVGIVILVSITAAAAGAFATISRLDNLQRVRIDRFVTQSDAASHQRWF